MTLSINTESRVNRPDLLAVIEDRGHRITEPRRSIINLLDQKQEGFNAEEVCDQLPEVGRATVYRTIKLLMECGVICKLALPDGTSKYSLARHEHHHHTFCVRCGVVAEFRDVTIERILRSIGGGLSGQIVGHRMEFYIICGECLALPEA